MLWLVVATLSVSAEAKFAARPCEEARLASHARCGTVTVPEDRSIPHGRQIGLNVIVIPAKQRMSEPQALFDLDGGPGLADTKNAGFYLIDGAAYSNTRDIVLIDQRGTGGSNPLDCPEFDAPDRGLQPMFPAASVRSCLKRLSALADLTKYRTDDAAADLDAVRNALGYKQIDLVALSYGTTLALRYIAIHGDKVRSAVLLSAVPPSAMPPRHHATAAQSALDQLFVDCAGDPVCSASYPALKDDLDGAMSKVRASGSLDTGVAMERLRTKLYSPGGARELPRIISRLAGGDRSVLESTNERAGFNYYDGVYLTITCSESLPWFNQKAAGLESNRTVFGDYRLKRQRDACRNWPRAPVRPDFFAPVHSTVPTLFISGGRDPVTPAAWAKKAASGFVRARHIIIPWAGHIVDGLSGLDTCYDPEVIRFLETADIKSVDQTCFAEMKPPPFKSIESAKR